MSQAVGPDRSSDSVTFEVERFERRGPGRLVLSGRWFGVAGRAFARPALTLGTDGDRRRTLAEPPDRSWSAREGELWEAMFPCELDGGDPGSIELTVGPDLTLALPAQRGVAERRAVARPRRDDLLDNLRGARRDGRTAERSDLGSDTRRADRLATRREDGLEAQREAPRAPLGSPRPRASSADPRPGSSDGAGDAAALAQRLTRARREIERLRAELARREAERDKAVRERDRAVERARKLTEEAALRSEQHTSRHGAGGLSRPGMGHASWPQRVVAVAVLVVVVIAFAVTARLL